MSAFDFPMVVELMYDDFRALAVVERGRAQLISRNGHTFASFSDLTKQIGAALPAISSAVLEGQIVCLDDSGKPQFTGNGSLRESLRLGFGRCRCQAQARALRIRSQEQHLVQNTEFQLFAVRIARRAF